MEMNERANALKEIFNNPSFQEKAKEIGTAEELQALLAEYKFEMTIEEVTEFLNVLFAKKASGEELNAEDLENVTGGILISGTAFLAWSVMYVALNVCTKLAGVW